MFPVLSPFNRLLRSRMTIYIHPRVLVLADRLVNDLGLKTDLAYYKVPKEDAGQIASLALGGTDSEYYDDVVKLLLGLYPA